MSDSITRFCERHSWRGAPEDLMGHLCDRLLADTESVPPVDVRLLASFRGAHLEEVEQPHAGVLTWDGERLLIRVRASDSEERRRFTACHEICHTFFPGFREAPRTRADADVERFDPRDPEEYLCDQGAAELLLPRRWLLASIPRDLTLDDVIEIAARSRASIEATAQRCVGLSTRPVAVVVLERADSTEALPPRVRRALCAKLPEIPAGTLVASDVPLSQALDQAETMYTGLLGLLPGTYSIAARSMPYEAAGKLIERAIAIVRPASIA